MAELTQSEFHLDTTSSSVLAICDSLYCARVLCLCERARARVCVLTVDMRFFALRTHCA